MKFPKFKLDFSDEFVEEYIELTRGIFRRGYLAEGPLVRDFEKSFSEVIGAEDAVFVGSGTDALQAAYMACLNEEKGENRKDFIIPVNTFVATDLAVRMAGGRSVYADVDNTTGNLTLSQLEGLITKNTLAIVYVHIGGFIDEEILNIKRLCEEKNIFLIEDAAHCVGSRIKNVNAGLIGDFGCFSFFPTKTMTTGEGGAVVSRRLNALKNIRHIKNFGRTTGKDDEHNIVGYNFKVSEMQAALGLSELKRLNSRLHLRRSIFARYAQNLELKKGRVLFSDRFSDSSCYKVILILGKDYAERVTLALSQHDIPLAGKVYSKPITSQIYNKNNEKFPNAERFCSNHICPLIYPELSIEQVDRICEIINGVKV